MLSHSPKSDHAVHEAVCSVFPLLQIAVEMILLATSTVSPTVSSLSCWSSSLAPLTHPSSLFNTTSVRLLYDAFPDSIRDVVAPVPSVFGITNVVAFVENHDDSEFDILVVAMEELVVNPAPRAAHASVEEEEQQPPSDADTFLDWLFQRLFDFIGRGVRWSLIQFGRSCRWWLQGCARWSYRVSKVGLRFVWTNKEAILSGGCRFVQFHVRLWWHNKGFVCSGLYRSTVFLAKLFRHNLGFIGSGLVAVVSFVVRLAWHNQGLIGTWILPCALLCWGLSVLVPWSLRTMRTIRCSIVRMFYRFLRFVVRSVVCCCCAIVLFLVLRL